MGARPQFDEGCSGVEKERGRPVMIAALMRGLRDFIDFIDKLHNGDVSWRRQIKAAVLYSNRNEGRKK